jgi:hypothetical protein
MDPAHLEHLGLTPDVLSESVSLERLRADWSEFLRSGDLLASWNTGTLRLSSQLSGKPQAGIALKSVYCNLRRFRGSLEEILAREGLVATGTSGVRALRRLSQALQLAELLRRHADA